ncbi:UNVERIFIED_CONTAM: hypothetical protein Sangu_1877600 [Sesamum angustifolium]|uniref:Uncharacterized protein n=1 Tax=Sesamum angustifolium TaxID=2727405 RepID=A0AAW2LWF1_9LAMI
MGDKKLGSPENAKVVDEKSVGIKGVQNSDSPKDKVVIPAILKPNTAQKGFVPIGKPVIGAPFKGNSIVSDSEVGPSPSEVAAALAQRRYLQDDNQSSVLDGWSLDESVEGLRSKLERWRTELPPLYDNGFSTSSYKSSGGQHGRRHSDGGSGLFSCFGNICGYECQCICGKPPGKRNQSRFAASSVGSKVDQYFENKSLNL